MNNHNTQRNGIIVSALKLCRLCVVVFCCLALTACGNKRKKNSERFQDSGMSAHGAMDTGVDQAYVEARLTDLPLPIGAKISYFVQSVGNFLIHFSTPTPIQPLADFYAAEMERLGWRKGRQMGAADQQLYIYEKPKKLCIIDVYEQRNGCLVRVFISEKN